jgi:hypothetical protein
MLSAQTWHKATGVQHLGQLALRESQMQVVDAAVLATVPGLLACD